GLLTGLALGKNAAVLAIPSQIILQMLGALAPPLIFVAVTHVLMTTVIPRKTALRLCGLLLLNTVMAIVIGLVVAYGMKPGKWSEPKPPDKAENKESESPNPFLQLVNNVPKSLLGPLGDNQNVIGVILIAIAFGIALRSNREKPLNTVQDLVEVAYSVL